MQAQVVISEHEADRRLTPERLNRARMLLRRLGAFVDSIVMSDEEVAELRDAKEVVYLITKSLARCWYQQQGGGTVEARQAAVRYFALLHITESATGLPIPESGGLPANLRPGLPTTLEEMVDQFGGFAR